MLESKTFAHCELQQTANKPGIPVYNKADIFPIENSCQVPKSGTIPWRYSTGTFALE